MRDRSDKPLASSVAWDYPRPGDILGKVARELKETRYRYFVFNDRIYAVLNDGSPYDTGWCKKDFTEEEMKS
jgi:hypothetical protein